MTTLGALGQTDLEPRRGWTFRQSCSVVGSYFGAGICSTSPSLPGFESGIRSNWTFYCACPITALPSNTPRTIIAMTLTLIDLNLLACLGTVFICV